MARKFITDKEFAFIEKINKELLQEFVGQEVIYYAISMEHTVSNDLYTESIDKVWFSPIRINARVEWDNSGVSTTSFTLDLQYSLIVDFHTQELTERNVKQKEGDLLEFGQVVFEIT